ncbi:uncharacterized protein LOC108989133 isoform X2 [Juglans regia]|uniref:Uncharacterized protein LOC108989133 isoform X2 n=1 Tax=Juglans regia TaxID=51240 RepID=A0A6P9EHZ4_JUGRE|nr:uncharacterized protein LOC108989133 isoform X2 [Juglans regia]
MKLGLYFCLLSGNILLGFSLFAAFGAFPPTIDATMTLSSVQHYQCIKKAGQPNYFRQFQSQASMSLIQSPVVDQSVYFP